jgi:SPP1 gp7 family putative phage head morphogenesis protein
MCIKCNTVYNLSEEFLEGLPPVFAKAMKDLHSGKIKPEDLSPELLSAIAKELWSGVSIGYGDSIDKTDLASLLQKNVYVFSGFKTYQQLKEASLLLTDGSGGLKPFTTFMQEVKAINQTYNINYLQAEYNNAIASGQMAVNWEDIQSRKEAAPYLKYKTAEDERVRLSHRGLNNVVKKVDDPFWNTYYPPNGWGCRCEVIQIIQAEETPEFDAPELPPMFRGNVGRDGIIFPDTHPYFGTNEKTRKIVTKKSEIAYQKDVLTLPINQQYKELLKTKDRGEILIHKLLNKGEDFSDVFLVANLFAEAGKKVKMLPEIHIKESVARAKVLPGVKGNRNPDLLVNNSYVEVEKTDKIENLSKRIRSGHKQADKVVVILNSNIQDLNFDYSAKKLFADLKDLEEILVINNTGKTLYKGSKLRRGN